MNKSGRRFIAARLTLVQKLFAEEIAKLVGVSPKTVSLWENHQAEPDSIEIYEKYNELSGFSIMYLMGKSYYSSFKSAQGKNNDRTL